MGPFLEPLQPAARAAQVLATAALLVAMNRAGFAVGTAMQQSSLPLAAIVGLIVFHDHLSGLAWLGVAITTAGLVALTWPKHATGPKPLSGAAFGLLSGLFFGFALNAFRHAGLALEPRHGIYAALVSLVVVQAMQSLVLTLVLAVRDPARRSGRSPSGWRRSLAAGLCWGHRLQRRLVHRPGPCAGRAGARRRRGRGAARRARRPPPVQRAVASAADFRRWGGSDWRRPDGHPCIGLRSVYADALSRPLKSTPSRCTRTGPSGMRRS